MQPTHWRTSGTVLSLAVFQPQSIYNIWLSSDSMTALAFGAGSVSSLSAGRNNSGPLQFLTPSIRRPPDHEYQGAMQHAWGNHIGQRLAGCGEKLKVGKILQKSAAGPGKDF